MNENVYRWLAVAIFASAASTSIYFRSRANTLGGEKISIRQEGLPIMLGLRISGFAMWLGILAYLVNPAWMAWSHVALPAWLRMSGVILGAMVDFTLFWVFSTLGNNVTPTVATRKAHSLVVTGPYRWIRHPLYVAGALGQLAFVLISGNWLIGVLAVTAFAFLLWRLPKEESGLLNRFGEQYAEYAAKTPRFVPKLG